MSIITNLLYGALKKTKRLTENKYAAIGLSWLQARRLKNLPEKGYSSTRFFRHTIRFYNRHELLHSIEEIFIKEIYKFDLPSGASPLIFDCGANIGLSVLYFKKQYPSSTIVAFEPDEMNFALLKHNIASQRVEGITIRKEAVWTTNTDIDFFNDGSTASKIEALPHQGAGKTTSVKAIRLKELITQKIDFLKIDIEGAEYDVLKDIEERLIYVTNLFLEYHGTFAENGKLEEMLQLLSRNNFSYYITEATVVYPTPFYRKEVGLLYDVQLNISCFKT